MTNRFSLKNRLAIITGGCGLLGLEHAEALLEKSCRVILLDNDAKKVKKFKKKFSKNNNILIKNVNVLIAEEFSRAADGGIGFTKAAGNYAAQFYPTALAEKQGYQQIVWTDAKSHEFLEEAGTMNIFFRIEDKLVTAPTNDRILDGVTRKSVIQIARDSGIEVEVRQIKIDEIVKASENNSLKEMFGSGTAVVINPIKSFGYKGVNYKLPELENPLSIKLKDKIMSIQYNLSEDPYEWRVAVD